MTALCKRTTSILATLLLVVGGVSALRAQEPPPPPAAPPPPQSEAPPGEAGQQAVPRTPIRLSFTSGEVSFWRPGADDWTPAQVNTPLAPGDALYSGANANLELQIGPRAFVRAGAGTQLELANQEPDFLQLKVTAGHASVDVRSIKAGQTIELDTPTAAFTIEASGYYRGDVTGDTTMFIARRGGRATMTPGGGEASGIAPSEEAVIQGGDNPRVETYAAPELDAWDRWNYDRTDHLIDAVSARYVPPGVYGIDALDHYGTWRVTADYGTVWVPQGVAPDWAPYSAGRWIWDPYYGWSWIDNAPWGWAPCHYGRWVHVSGYWGWAPGPLVVAPVYAPALVAFFGGHHFGVSIGIGAPAVGWVALGWGEPLVPWWGHPGFVGVPSWHGWGGPRVVNNVVINRTTVVNVTNINVYQNVNVRNAVIAAREDRFGRGVAEHVRVGEIDPHQLEPVRGRVPVQPVAASLAPRVERGARPPEAVLNRSVVATRAPRDTAAPLRAEGLNVAHSPAAAPRIVPAPSNRNTALTAPRPAFGQQGMTERVRPPEPPQYGVPRPGQQRQPERGTVPAERAREARPAAPSMPATHGPAEHAPAPAVRERREAPPPQPAPQHAAPPPPPERRAPAARLEQPAHNLPGEPANRVYRPQPEMRGASPHHNAGAARESEPRRKRENQR